MMTDEYDDNDDSDNDEISVKGDIKYRLSIR